jgi:hypothetical protein
MSALEHDSPPDSNRQPHLPIAMRLIALFGAPLAWLLQMWFCEPLAAHACYPRTKTLEHPLLNHLSLDLAGIGLAALLAGSGALLIAWRGRQIVGNSAGAKSPTTFLLELGVLISVACVIAIVFTLAAAILVAPCLPWS